MFAIIKTGGKQYKVAEGDVITIEKINSPAGGQNEKFEFNDVLLVADGQEVKIGRPFVENAKVEAKILEDGKGDKKMVFRYKSKTRQRKKKGHRQPYTKLQILKISA